MPFCSAALILRDADGNIYQILHAKDETDQKTCQDQPGWVRMKSLFQKAMIFTLLCLLVLMAFSITPAAAEEKNPTPPTLEEIRRQGAYIIDLAPLDADPNDDKESSGYVAPA